MKNLQTPLSLIAIQAANEAVCESIGTSDDVAFTQSTEMCAVTGFYLYRHYFHTNTITNG